MGTRTGIAWTDATWNPIRGCSRVSAGCENCYAETFAARFAGEGQPYNGLLRLDANGKPKAQWNGVIKVVDKHLEDPLRWQSSKRIFVNSMSDLFHENVPFETVARIFGIMALAPRHTFQVLTKRVERVVEFSGWLRRRCASSGVSVTDDLTKFAAATRETLGVRPTAQALSHVFVGVSVEDQATADKRIPTLMHWDLLGSQRFVSYEPALGPVTFRDEWLLGYFDYCPEDGEVDGCAGCPGYNQRGYDGDCQAIRGPAIDWVIVGGESGAGARPFDLAWARSTVSQCRDSGVPCFVKQLGSRHRGTVHLSRSDGSTITIADPKAADPNEWPEDLRVQEFPR